MTTMKNMRMCFGYANRQFYQGKIVFSLTFPRFNKLSKFISCLLGNSRQEFCKTKMKNDILFDKHKPYQELLLKENMYPDSKR